MANVIMLVVGNKHPQDIYTETFMYIEARFEVINVDHIGLPPIVFNVKN